MSANLGWYTKALYGFDHVVRLANGAGAWNRPSPCDGWTARHVVGHVLAIQRYIEACVEGRQPPMNPMADPDRHTGDDPRGAWAAARDDVLAALDHHGVLRREVATFRGTERVDDLIGFNVVDTTVHSWDLARALGVDDRLDVGLVARATALVEPRADAMRSPMVFGPRVELDGAADAQSELLALVGRKA